MRHHPQRTNRHRNINASSVLCYIDTTPRPTLFFCGGRIPVGGTLYTPAQAQSFSRGLDTQDMNVGSALFYTLDYYISERISLGFSHAFRYDHIADLSENSGDPQAIVPDQIWFDHELPPLFEL